MPPNYPKKRQRLFFVNTKTTCFLCLQQIPPDLGPTPVITLDESDDDDVVEMKRLEEQKTEKKKQEPLCLRSIFKLIGMDAGKVLSQKLTAGPNKDLTVMLCQTCRQVATQLNVLFSEWETLQMKLEYAVRKFTEILQNSESDPNLMENLRKNSFDPLDVAQLIRKETLIKCTNHLQKSWPKVNIVTDTALNKKTQDPRAATVVPSAPLVCLIPTTKTVEHPNQLLVKRGATGEYICNICSQAFQVLGNLFKHMQGKHQVSAASCRAQNISQGANLTCSDCGCKLTTPNSLTMHKKNYCRFSSGAPPVATCNRSLSELLGSMPRIEMDGTEKNFCGLCSFHINGDTFTDKQLKRHICIHHHDHLFAFAKRPGFDRVKFQKLCENLFKNELLAISDSSQANIDGGVTFSCLYCPTKDPDKGAIYSHMVEEHFSIYSSKLAELQQQEPQEPQECSDGAGVDRGSPSGSTHTCSAPESLDRQPTNSCPVNRPTHFFRCQNCAKTFTNGESAVRHCKQDCPHRNSEVSGSVVRIQKFASSSPSTKRPVIYSSIRITSRSAVAAIPPHPQSANIPLIASSMESQQSCNVESPSVYPCQDCKVEFREHARLLEHVSKYHLKQVGRDGKSSGWCECGGFYVDLQAHVKLKGCDFHYKKRKPAEHRQDRVSCEYCGSALSRASLPRHHRDVCKLFGKAARENVTPFPTTLSLSTSSISPGNSGVQQQSTTKLVIGSSTGTQSLLDKNDAQGEEVPMEFNPVFPALKKRIIQVREPSQIQVLREPTRLEGGEMMMIPEESVQLKEEFSEVLELLELEPENSFESTSGFRKMENPIMILPDIEDPLQC